MQDVFLEHEKGRAVYDHEMAKLGKQLEKIRAAGEDRPVHWEGRNDASDALGRLPYVQRASFLYRLRTELGEQKFWRGLALYTTRNAGRLVDSEDFQRAMERPADES